MNISKFLTILQFFFFYFSSSHISIFDKNDHTNRKYFNLSSKIHRVGIEYTQGHEQNAYLAATYVKKEEPKEEPKKPAPLPEASDTDSDSN